MKKVQLQSYYSKNKKLNNLLLNIEEQLKYLGIDEVKHYMEEFPNEIDYNIVQYGNLLVYYSQVREFYAQNGYKCIDKMSDAKLWETYKRQVGYVARHLNPIIRL